jgi:hypothetical protein
MRHREPRRILANRARSGRWSRRSTSPLPTSSAHGSLSSHRESIAITSRTGWRRAMRARGDAGFGRPASQGR